MEFKPLIDWMQRQIMHGRFGVQLFNPKDISDPIVKAIKENSGEGSIDVADAINKNTKALGNIEFPDFNSVKKLLTDLLNKKEKDVIIKKININNTELLDILEKIESKTAQEQIDFTPILIDIYNLLEDKDVDLSKIEKFIKEFPIENKRVQVELPEEQVRMFSNKAGRFMSSENVKDSSGNRINPATSELQEQIKTAIENMSVSVDTSDLAKDEFYYKLTKRDYDVSENQIYVGKNTDVEAADGDTDWIITKFTYDINGNETIRQTKTGSWTGRVALFA